MTEYKITESNVETWLNYVFDLPFLESSEVELDKDSFYLDRLGLWLPSVVDLLKKWTERFPYDFRDDRVMAHVRNVTHLCVSLEASIRDEVSIILQTLLDRLTELENHEERLQHLSQEPIMVDIMQVCGDTKIIAEQLVVLELDKMSYIGPEEFVQAYLQDNQRLDTKRTLNLETYVSWFDRLSYLVATHICQQAKSKGRAKILHMWMDIAQHCLQLRNFNSLMAILAGINLPPITRLKKTVSL
ncbi:ras-GEF domain-containing family member 1B-like [Lycorma delicatula]|uniref:ras-GEF domain-containing family member 1B-like n=1 Tax=Lycorma delicatula TaxID=130591 RepID=UPI003F50E644